jgi:MFS family permease
MQTFTQFAVCIFVLSTLGESFRPANAAAIAAYTDDSNRTRGYSLNRLAINLGWSIGPAIGGILASINYHLLFWADGITCMLASVILYHYLKPGEKGQVSKKEVVKEKGSSAYKDGVFLQGMFYVFLIGLCFFQLFSLLPLFYKDQLHLNEAMIGALIAGNGLIIVVFEMILVYKLERLGKVIHYIMIGSFLIGLSFLTLNLAPWVSVAILSMAMVSFGEMLLFPFINNFWVNRSSEQNRGQYAAVFAISFAAANVLAPTLSMYLAEKSSFALVWVVDFFICTFAALGFYLLKKQIA